MVGHQQFEKSSARLNYFVGVRSDHQAGFNRAHARSGVDRPSHVHHAHPTDSHRRFILLVAQRRDGDSIHPCRVKHGRARGDADPLAVNRELHQGVGTHAMLPTLAKQTPDGHSRRVMCASTSSRKCFSTEAIGAGTTCPSPQIDVARSAWVSSSIN